MITFEHVTKRFADGTVAVDDLSLEMPAHQVTVLVGTSGCGKTTSLRMINQMITPSSGRVVWDGTDVATMKPETLRRQMGYVIQQAGLFPHRTVVDNVATVPRLLGADRRTARARAMEVLERVGLDASYAKRYPHQLSGGQQQRVGVARALAADPPVMLMDEPFSAVDPVVRKGLQDELLRLQAELHKTIVFVTHDIDEAVKLGDRVAVLRTGGRLVQFDSPVNVLTAPADDFVESFVGHDRGVRRLSFFPAAGLALDRSVNVGDEWSVVLDDEQRPTGWRAVGAPELLPLGHTFDVERDSLRAALDAAVLSPCGAAVAVDGDGRFVGTASETSVAAAVRSAVSSPADSAGESAADSAPETVP